jgi:hypothetical protein
VEEATISARRVEDVDPLVGLDGTDRLGDDVLDERRRCVPGSESPAFCGRERSVVVGSVAHRFADLDRLRKVTN